MKTLLFLLFVSGCCGWSKTDTILEISSQASLVGDWYTTEKGLDNGLVENNPIMGPAGDRIPTAVYFPATMVLHFAVAAALPPKWRNAFQGATIGVQSKVIIDNWREIERVKALQQQ